MVSNLVMGSGRCSPELSTLDFGKSYQEAPTRLKTPSGEDPLVRSRRPRRPDGNVIERQRAGPRGPARTRGSAPLGVFMDFGGPQAHGNSLTVAVRSSKMAARIAVQFFAASAGTGRTTEPEVSESAGFMITRSSGRI